MSKITDSIFTPQPSPTEPTSKTPTIKKESDLTTKKIVASATSGLFGFGLLATAGLATGMTAGILPLALAGGVALGSSVGFFANKFFDTSKKDALENFNNFLKNIEEEAKTDLYLNDEFIEKKFEISKALAPLSDTEQRQCRLSLQKTVNHAYLTRELKQMNLLYSSNKNESILLIALGVKEGETPYDDKDFLRGNFDKAILKEINQNEKSENFCSLSSLKDSLKNQALIIRLNAAEIDNPLQIEKFKIYLKISPDLDKKLKEFGNDFPLPLSENFPFSADSDIVYSLTKYFNIIKSESIEIELAVISFKLKEFFIDENINALEFEQVIEEKSKIFLAENTIIDTCKECKEYFDLLNKINHFNKWGNYFQTNMMQGIKDTNEVLGEGVCFGFAHRIISYIQNDPTMSIEKFTEAIKKITSQDRIYQATMSAHLTHFSPSIYTDIFRISKYKSEELKVVKIPQSSSVVEITKSSKLFVNNNMIPELTVAFKSLENLKKFNSSPGWLMMEVEKHIFPIRWDTKNNCYWVLDSNQGLLCFENSLTSSADAKELCIEYLSDLIKLNYSGTNEIVLSQYIKKDA